MPRRLPWAAGHFFLRAMRGIMKSERTTLNLPTRVTGGFRWDFSERCSRRRTATSAAARSAFWATKSLKTATFARNARRSFRRGSLIAAAPTVDQIREQLDWREANQQRVAQFNPTRTLGNDMKVILDEDAGRFIVTRSSRWREANPDVLDFSQVTGCDTEIRESRTELHWKDSDGEEHDYDPPRYDIDYDMYLTIHVNVPYYDSITFKVNGSRIEERNSVEYREAERPGERNSSRAHRTSRDHARSPSLPLRLPRLHARAPSVEPPPRRMLLGAANTAAAPWVHKLQGEEPKKGSGTMNVPRKSQSQLPPYSRCAWALLGCRVAVRRRLHQELHGRLETFRHDRKWRADERRRHRVHGELRYDGDPHAQ